MIAIIPINFSSSPSVSLIITYGGQITNPSHPSSSSPNSITSSHYTLPPIHFLNYTTHLKQTSLPDTGLSKKVPSVKFNTRPTPHTKTGTPKEKKIRHRKVTFDFEALPATPNHTYTSHSPHRHHCSLTYQTTPLSPSCPRAPKIKPHVTNTHPPSWPRALTFTLPSPPASLTPKKNPHITSHYPSAPEPRILVPSQTDKSTSNQSLSMIP